MTRRSRAILEEMSAVNHYGQVKSTSLLNSGHDKNTSGNGVSMLNNYCECCDCMPLDSLNRTEPLAKQPYTYRSFKKEQFIGIDPEDLATSIIAFEKQLRIMCIYNEQLKVQAAMVAFPTTIISGFLKYTNSTTYAALRKYILDMSVPKYACHQNSKVHFGLAPFHELYLDCHRAITCPITERLKAEMIRRAPKGITKILKTKLHLPIEQFRSLACAAYEANQHTLLSQKTAMTEKNRFINDKRFTRISTKSNNIPKPESQPCFYHKKFGNKARNYV